MAAEKGNASGPEMVLWMPLALRLQHGVLVLSVLFLCLSGFVLHFHQSAVAAFFIRLEGGFAARGIIHRIAGIGMAVVVMWHFVYVVFTEEGHRQLMKLVPATKDLRDFAAQVRMNFGQDVAAPELDRFGFREKFQYWAVAFLTIMMIATGILLWFGSETMALFPKFVIDIIRIFHGSEATFAFVAIFLWHIYNVHASPGRVTLPGTALTGVVPLEAVRKLHPVEFERLRKEREQP